MTFEEWLDKGKAFLGDSAIVLSKHQRTLLHVVTNWKLSDMVMDYLKANPDCQRRQMMIDLNVNKSSLNLRLRTLREFGLVDRRREGTMYYYSLSAKALEEPQ